jgi:hypothetical protein
MLLAPVNCSALSSSTVLQDSPIDAIHVIDEDTDVRLAHPGPEASTEPTPEYVIHSAR